MPNPVRILLLAVLLACCAGQIADGADLPKRKAGQWQITTTSSDAKIPPRIEDVCLDDATSALLDRFALGASQRLCSKYDIKALGNGRVSVEATCKLGATQMTIQGDMVFDGSTAYRETVKTHFEPPMRGRSDSTSVHDAKWTGVCAADMKPGDIVTHPSPTMPMAMRMNLDEMMKE